MFRVSTFPGGSGLGSGVGDDNERLCGVRPGTGFTGTSMAFDYSENGGTTWFPVCDQGVNTDYSITVAVDRFTPVKLEVFAGLSLVRPRTVANQTGGVQVMMKTRPLS